MPEYTPGSPIEATDPPAATLGPVRRKPDLDQRIFAEEVRLLIGLGQTSRYSMFIAILVVGSAFYGVAPLWATGVILIVQIIAQLYFDQVRTRFHADPDIVPHAMQWAQRYTWGTCISGFTWGLGGILWLPGADFAHQAFYALVLASVSIATVITRATYPPAVLTYIGTAVTPSLVIVLMTPEVLHLATAALALLFLFIMAGWTRQINVSYREAIRLRFENADLVERMARANAATEQKRSDAEEAERRARAANRSKDEFLNILGRQVKAPLDTLAQMAHQLQDESQGDVQRNLADAMGSSSEKLRQLFDDMIDFSQMEAQTLDLNLRLVDPVEHIRTLVREMRVRASERNLSLELDVVPGSLPLVRTDPARLKQVLVNLISNSIKFTESGGVIVRAQSVTLADKRDALRFSVIDTGIGITADARTKLFEGFAQGGSDHSSGGMGLGLAISDRLVRLMGGRIEVDSAVGQGSTFWFLLPCDGPGKGEIARVAQSAVTPTPLRAPTRLIDYDFLNEMDRALGPDPAADRMVETLTHITELYGTIEQADANGNSDQFHNAARALQTAARHIGLVTVTEMARALQQTDEQNRHEDISRLHACLLETWVQLARAYPNLSMNEPDLNGSGT